MNDFSFSEILTYSKPYSLGSRTFTSKTPLIIAEVGTSHAGEISKATELIDAAREAGANCVKFQAVYAEEIIRPETGTVLLPNGPTLLYDSFLALERPQSFYIALKEMTENAGMLFLCTPFGLKSARMLKAMNAVVMKIASPELNHTQLLREIAGYRLPVILSSGVSTLADIEYALSFFNPEGMALLHCVTSYPAPEEDYNLSLMPSLSRIFDVPIGVSDHSSDPVLIPALSILFGGCIIEKHFTLSHISGGLDDPIALEPEDFSKMTNTLRRFSTLTKENAFMELCESYGIEKIKACIGNGKKKLADSELSNYSRTNRSIHAVCDISKDTIFSKENIAIVRTEKILRPGIQPCFYETIVGRKAQNPIPSGEGIRWDDVGGF